MAQASYPFDNIDTTETQFSYWAKNLSGNGYGGVMGYPGDTSIQVNTSASGLVVTVNPGYAIVRGFAYSNDATITLTLNTATQNRYDRIVLRLDPSANSIVAAVVTGVGATSPTLPGLTQTDTGIYEMELANIYIPAGSVLTTSGTLTDTRTFLGEQVGKWSTAGRPSGPMVGRMGWNTTLTRMEYWDGSAWQPTSRMAWSTAGRPSSPTTGIAGFNTDFGYWEYWTGSAWQPIAVPVWTTATRPATPTIGITGFNTTLSTIETWTGSTWSNPVPSTIDPFLLMGA